MKIRSYLFFEASDYRPEDKLLGVQDLIDGLPDLGPYPLVLPFEVYQWNVDELFLVFQAK